jgi:hypothetical protein
MSFNINFFMPDNWWMFVRDRDFVRQDLDRHFVGRRENHDLITNARAIENTRIDNSRKVTYVTGPDARDVRAITGRDIKPLPVNEYNQPGKTVVGKDQVTIYRPPVSRENAPGKKPVPGTTVSRENIKPVAERTKGDLTRTNSNTNLRTGKEQMPPANNTVPPKYERTDKINPNNSTRVSQAEPLTTGQTRDAGKVNVQKRQVPPQKVAPPSEYRNQQPPVETRRVEPSGQNRYQQPPVETRRAEPSGQKQMGAPVQRTQPVQQQVKPNASNSYGTGNDVKKSSSTPAVRSGKGDTPATRRN